MTANKERGEVEVKLGGKDYVLRPTFQCLCEIETQLQVGIMVIAKRVQSYDFGIQDVAVILTAGLKAGGEKGVTVQKVGEMVFQDGVDKFGYVITEFLRMALGGPPKGNAETADES